MNINTKSTNCDCHQPNSDVNINIISHLKKPSGKIYETMR